MKYLPMLSIRYRKVGKSCILFFMKWLYGGAGICNSRSLHLQGIQNLFTNLALTNNGDTTIIANIES